MGLSGHSAVAMQQFRGLGAVANIDRRQMSVGWSPTIRHRLGATLNGFDTAILDSVWTAFMKVAAEFPDDEGVMLTLQYHACYLRQCTNLSQRTGTPGSG